MKKKAETSSESEVINVDEVDEIKSVDSTKHAIDFFNSKRQRSRESEQNNLSRALESEKENQREKFVPLKVQQQQQPLFRRPSVELVETEVRSVRERFIRRESEGERSSRKSEQKRSPSRYFE